jgi:hypothetical protein
LFCQETSQQSGNITTSKSCSRENVLLWKIILQNILVHTRIIKIQMLNCYCQLSSSFIFRQYDVSQSECNIDRPRPGLPRLSPRPHTEALGTRLEHYTLLNHAAKNFIFDIFNCFGRRTGRRVFQRFVILLYINTYCTCWQLSANISCKPIFWRSRRYVTSRYHPCPKGHVTYRGMLHI